LHDDALAMKVAGREREGTAYHFLLYLAHCGRGVRSRAGKILSSMELIVYDFENI